MPEDRDRPVVRVKPRSYQPTAAELNEPIVFPAGTTPEESGPRPRDAGSCRRGDTVTDAEFKKEMVGFKEEVLRRLKSIDHQIDDVNKRFKTVDQRLNVISRPTCTRSRPFSRSTSRFKNLRTVLDGRRSADPATCGQPRT